jgi:trans-2,3-dihydro-3-hydroxyanthranilate isomerase
MARSYRYLHYDVFTDQLFGGNQLAVVLDGRGLTTATMQAIAKEMNFAETTFVLPAERPDTDVRMRIFTPAAELPVAGHPTIGSTFALARAGVIAEGREQVVFGLGVGPVPVALTWRGSDLRFAWMTQGSPAFAEPLADRGAVAAALSLPETALAANLPAQVVSCGVPFLFVALSTRADVDAASAVPGLLAAVLQSTGTGAHGVFIFSPEAGPADHLRQGSGGQDAGLHVPTVYSRMFAPELGVAEDPATGIASGPLGSYLVRHQVVARESAGALLSLQGVRMGRPSHVHISIGVDGDAITSVRVGGESVLAGEGLLYI